MFRLGQFILCVNASLWSLDFFSFFFNEGFMVLIDIWWQLYDRYGAGRIDHSCLCLNRSYCRPVDKGPRMRKERETQGRSHLVVKTSGDLQRLTTSSQKGMLYLAGPCHWDGIRKAGGPRQRSGNTQKAHGPSLASGLAQITPANALVSGADCQGKENAGEEQSPRDWQ